ncbi:hypothetical protein V1511DRAFT_521821 [Dipodascopsis uninucleata]
MLSNINYPPKLSLENHDRLRIALRDWSLSHGLVIRGPTESGSADSFAETAGLDSKLTDERAVHVPLTLFPSPFPRKLFEQARGLQKDFNELYVRVSDDDAFLQEIVKELADVDEFMGDLYKLHKEVEKIGVSQPLSLGIFRSDYLLNVADNGSDINIRQVELNTISASFGGLSSRVADAHRFLRKSGLYKDTELVNSANEEPMPENPSAKGLAKGLAVAHKAYNVQDSYVLFVVQPGERNAFDQRWLEYRLLEDHGIFSIRASLAEIAIHGELDNDTRILTYKGSHISVVYYRSGYTPADYPTQETWNARKTMELSKAIKCPTIATHFAGAKKIQQVLINDEILSKFVTDENVRSGLKSTFAEILPLDDSDHGKRARELISTCPEKYVLKPQREGGGNNVYKEKIPGFVKSLPNESHARGYILMELIVPPSDTKNSIIRNGIVTEGYVISELGIFGCVLWDSSTHEIKENFEAGWLLRTKFAESEEGGVAAGFGSIDSVVLI